AVLTPLTLAEGRPEYPELIYTVIDTTVPRRSAEFYRQLLGYIYRPGDEPGSGADSVDPARLALTGSRGRRTLALPGATPLEPTTWPTPDAPMQLPLAFTATHPDELPPPRRRAEDLCAELIAARSDAEDERLSVFTDHDGHP